MNKRNLWISGLWMTVAFVMLGWTVVDAQNMADGRTFVGIVAVIFAAVNYQLWKESIGEGN